MYQIRRHLMTAITIDHCHKKQQHHHDILLIIEIFLTINRVTNC